MQGETVGWFVGERDQFSVAPYPEEATWERMACGNSSCTAPPWNLPGRSQGRCRER